MLRLIRSKDGSVSLWSGMKDNAFNRVNNRERTDDDEHQAKHYCTRLDCGEASHVA